MALSMMQSPTQLWLRTQHTCQLSHLVRGRTSSMLHSAALHRSPGLRLSTCHYPTCMAQSSGRAQAERQQHSNLPKCAQHCPERTTFVSRSDQQRWDWKKVAASILKWGALAAVVCVLVSMATCCVMRDTCRLVCSPSCLLRTAVNVCALTPCTSHWGGRGCLLCPVSVRAAPGLSELYLAGLTLLHGEAH